MSKEKRSVLIFLGVLVAVVGIMLAASDMSPPNLSPEERARRNLIRDGFIDPGPADRSDPNVRTGPTACEILDRMEKEYEDATTEWYTMEPGMIAGTLTPQQQARMVQLQSLFVRLNAEKTVYAIENASELSRCRYAN